ncbi:metal transporter [Shewanella surugensis]|uniref:Metal transporter n=1 Tax=Shewanella surugensis TaxID=212020 RepID=A0ABT0L8K6_9GAMM|nr:metal transporter [Shewanella surugensis]MCL1124038.1 metal transporter [Shewanella surugensis]
MLYLAASCIALLLGPVFYRFFTTGTGLQKGLDGFIFVSLGGLVLIHILPELLEHGGLLSILFLFIGMWGPSASERLFHKYSNLTHNITLFLGVSGLLLHTLTDGGAMVLAQQAGNSSLLALGVILHRLPIGLAIWWLLKPQVGTRWAIAVLTAMMLLTSVGYFAGEQLLAHLSLDNTVYLQAFVTGSILHVVIHQPHAHSKPDHQGKYEYQAGIGSLLGIGLLFGLMLMGSDGHEHNHHAGFVPQLLQWMLTIAPILLICYLAAGVRYALGLTPNIKHPKLKWIQSLIGPETLLITGLLLGPWLALFQAVGILCITGYLTYAKVIPNTATFNSNDTFWKFGLSHIVDRSAPWVLLSLILVNLISYPSVLLIQPIWQVIILALFLFPMRFCPIGAAVLSLSLAYGGWSISAILLPLLAAPLINITQLKQMRPAQRIILAGLIIFFITLAQWINPQWHAIFNLPEWVNALALVLLSLLFSISLLRLGPRKFLLSLVIFTPKPHIHEQQQHH